MNAEMKEAEKHITGMEKWCGLCVCPWNRFVELAFLSFFFCFLAFFCFAAGSRAGKVRDVEVYAKKDDKGNSGKAVKTKEPKKGGQDVRPDGPYVQRITNDAREDEMEENMQAVGSVLGNLKAMAQDMNEEIDKQNKQVDRITAKVVQEWSEQAPHPASPSYFYYFAPTLFSLSSSILERQRGP